MLRICLSPFIIIVMIWVILVTIVDDPGQPKYSIDTPHRLINVVVLYDIVDFLAPFTSIPPYWNGDQGLDLWGVVRIGGSKSSPPLFLGPASTGGA